MAHDVFISYSSVDKPIADAVCSTLEDKKVRCWIAPRDVLAGLSYGEAEASRREVGSSFRIPAVRVGLLLLVLCGGLAAGTWLALHWGEPKNEDPPKSPPSFVEERDIAHVRADWFIATASRPPLYPLLLELPATQRELEKKLGIDYAAAFRDNRLSRAGVFHSGVSPHNRVFDRIPIAQGAYWLSYDTASGDGRNEMARHPLGPRLAEHPFPQSAFHHDGSTVLFNLPNGLQAYAAFDADGRRLAAVGGELLHDFQGTAGSSTVVAGLSCIGCHKLSPGRFADDLRQQANSTGMARKKLEQLVPRQGSGTV